MRPAKQTIGVLTLLSLAGCAEELHVAPAAAAPPVTPASWMDWPGPVVGKVSAACVPPTTRVLLPDGQVCGAVDLDAADPETTGTCGALRATRGEPQLGDASLTLHLVDRAASGGSPHAQQVPLTWLVLADGTSCFPPRGSAQASEASAATFLCRDGTSLCGEPSLRQGVLRVARCDLAGRASGVEVPACLAGPLPSPPTRGRRR